MQRRKRMRGRRRLRELESYTQELEAALQEKTSQVEQLAQALDEVQQAIQGMATTYFGLFRQSCGSEYKLDAALSVLQEHDLTPEFRAEMRELVEALTAELRPLEEGVARAKYEDLDDLLRQYPLLGAALGTSLAESENYGVTDQSEVLNSLHTLLECLEGTIHDLTGQFLTNHV